MQKRINGIVTAPMKVQDFMKNELGLTRRQISQAKFRSCGILVNGKRSRVTSELAPGDQVEVLLEADETGSAHLVKNSQSLDILYEDEDLLAVNKPAGLVVHPSHGHYEDSLANMANFYFESRGEMAKIRPIGRLDKETSGIVLFAKNQVAAARLAIQKEKGIFQKEYTAIVAGCLKEKNGTVTTGISKDPSSLIKMMTDENGMYAVTHYKVMQEYESYSIISLWLETGRTHQIRVHMASLGHPLLGDRLYGKTGLNSHQELQLVMDRAALHAGKCILEQPFTKEVLLIEAPLPKDMNQYLS